MRTNLAIPLTTFAALAIACAPEDRTALVIPDAPHVARFSATRFLADADLRVPMTEGQQLAAQLLGRDRRATSRATAAVTPAKKPSRAKPRAAPVVEDVVEETYEAYVPFDLSESSFENTVSGWTGFKTCVRAARASGGAMKVAFSIANSGDVKRTRVVDTSNALARSLAPCVERKARLLNFPAFENDENVTRVATFVF